MSFWTHLAAETREGAHVTWHWGARAGALVAALHLIGAAGVAIAAAGTAEERLMRFVAVGAYGFVQGFFAGLAVGLTALARRMAGWGLAAPLILVPIGVGVACWFGSDMLSETAHKLAAAMHQHLPDSQGLYSILHIPLLYVMCAPFLLLYLLVTPSILIHALMLYYLSMLVIIGGTLGGAVVSAPILLFTTWRRVRARAEKRNQATRNPFGAAYMSLEDAQPIAG